MLDYMRKLSSGIISKTLMLLLVLSFGLWGIGDILTERGPSYAAKVGGENISISEFRNHAALVNRQLQSIGMDNSNKGTIELMVIRQLVQQKLSLLAMRDVGLFVSDGQLGKSISDLPQFQDASGKFSGTLFTSILKRENISEKIFLNDMKHEILGRFLSDSLSMDDSVLPTSILVLENISRGETRDVVLLTVAARTPPAVSDADSRAYYDENKEIVYLQPERRTLDYLTLTPEDLKGVADSAASGEEAMHALSNRIEDELAAGMELDKALAKLGIISRLRTLTSVISSMAETANDDLTSTVITQGFSMSDGEISGLIRTKSGLHAIVMVKSITPAAPKPYDSVKNDVMQRLTRKLAREGARAKALTVKTALTKTPNWQSVAAKFALHGRVVSAVARPAAAGDESTPASGNIPRALQEAIFEHNLGEVAGPLVQENGDQLIALVTASHLPDLRSDAVALEKTGAPTMKKLAQEIENRAYQSFAVRHTVKINPALRSASMPEQAAP